MIPQCSPSASYNSYKEEIDLAIQNVLNRGWYILGNQVESFENNFAGYNSSKFCTGVASGTDALILSLKALGIGYGDGVISVSHTAVATVAAIEAVGAVPILLDVYPDTFNLDVNKLKEFLEKYNTTYKGVSIKAVIPVHLYGQPCDIEAIVDIARKYDLKVVEDCSQAHGAEFNGIKVGNFGDISTFSFYPTKNLGAIGDGGAVVTNSKELHGKVVSLRQYGWEQRYVSSIQGLNSRLDELQASILNVKIKYLEQEIVKRREIAGLYNTHLNGKILIPHHIEGCRHVYHLYVIKSGQRNSLKEYLMNNGIQTAIHYPLPVHLQPAYLNRVLFPYAMKNTEVISSEILSLPLFPELDFDKVNYVIKTIKSLV